MSKGYTLISNGSDNHLILLDLRPLGINGAMWEKVLDLSDITLNKNSIIGDTNAFTPGGVRIGTTALTTRGFVETDFEYVATLIDRGIRITRNIAQNCDNIVEFTDKLECYDAKEITDLKKDVNDFASFFPIPGL